MTKKNLQSELIFSFAKVNSYQDISKRYIKIYENSKKDSFFYHPIFFEKWVENMLLYSELYLLSVSDANEEDLLFGFFGKKKKNMFGFWQRDHYFFCETGNVEFDALYAENNIFLYNKKCGYNINELGIFAFDNLFNEKKINPKNIKLNRIGKGLYAVLNSFHGEIRMKKIITHFGFLTNNQSKILTCKKQNKNIKIDFEYLKKYSFISKNSYEAVRSTHNKLQKNGKVTLSYVTNEKDMHLYFSWLMEKNIKRFKHKSSFKNKKFVNFHKNLLSTFDDFAHLIIVKCDGKIIAMLYNFKESEIIFNYQSAFLYEEFKNINIGLYTYYIAMIFYFDHYTNYIKCFDFMIGENQLKKSLSNSKYKNYSIEL